MRHLLPQLLLLAICCASICAMAVPAPVFLSEQAAGSSLTGRLGVLIDTEQQLTIDQVKQLAAERFSYPNQVLRFAHDPRNYWLRIDVRGRSDRSWVLHIASVAQYSAQFYGPFDRQGRGSSTPAVFGFKYPFSQRPLGSEHIAFPFQLSSDQAHTLYVQLRSDMPQNYAAQIFELGQYSKTVRSRQLIDGLCYGVLAAMLVYNLLLLLVFRDKTYIWYVLTVAFALLSVASYNGHAAHYLFPASPQLTQLSYVLAPPLWVLFGLLFGRSFLEMRRYSPKLYLLSHLLLSLLLVPLGAGLLGQASWAQASTELIASVGTVLLVIASILAIRRAYHPARWYLLGQFTLFAAVLLVIADNRGLIDVPLIYAFGLQVGAAVEVVIFALALGSRIQMMQLKNRELRARTRALAAAAETDPLTGLANRAGLAAQAIRLLHGGQHSLILIDLNRFKPINDQFGHDAGDKVLIEIARRLDEQVRDRDLVARLGGDEFVVLLEGLYDRQTLSNISVRLIDRIGMPIEVDGRQLEVGSSLGLALYPEHGRDLAELLKAADVAMYEVKASHHAGFAFADENPPPADASLV